MKTLQISDELYNNLMLIAKEYVTQDKRWQAEPCMFMPMQKVHRLKPDGCGSRTKIIARDDSADEYESWDDLKDYYKNNLENYEDISFEEFCEDYIELDYDVEDSFETRGAINPFFTAKYCDVYIHNDKHNLEDKNAVSYAFTPVKNFEMQTIAKFLMEIGK